MSPPRVAIIGAGLTGLSCANYLRGLPSPPDVTIFEKSRSVGGRLATNTNIFRTPIDHGAPHFTLQNPFAKQLVTRLVPDLRQLPLNAFITYGGQVITQKHQLYYCVSGNNAIAQKLAQGMDIRFHHHATSVQPDATVRYRCVKDEDETSQAFDIALVTCPLPQAAALLHETAPPSHTPCLTALLAYNRAKLPNHPILSASSGRPPYAIVSDDVTIILDSFKRRARGNLITLIVQAGSQFSKENLEQHEEEWCEVLAGRAEELWKLPLEARIGMYPKRWRYANAKEQFGDVLQTSENIFVAGDGVHGGGVEDSIVGGRDVAKRICERLGLREG